MEVAGKKVLVLGLGKSGTAAAAFLASRGARVTASDAKGIEDLEAFIKTLDQQERISLILGVPQEASLIQEDLDLVVKSPGVPPGIPPLVEAERRKIPIFSEIELAYAFIKASIIGVTGTNGKTTTTTLVAEILKKAGRRVHLGGNIGTPLLALVEGCRPGDLVVTELSSFQLVNIRDFRCRTGVFLNITPDHLDYHGTFEAYLEAKANIFANQQPEDFAVLNHDDPLVRALRGRSRGKPVFFSASEALEEGVCVENEEIIIASKGRSRRVLGVRDLALPGRHNLENSLAAVAAADCLGVAPDVTAEVLASFAGVEHRLEWVAEISGVAFVNDSKGTNPDAAARALESFNRPIILIAGGIDKGGSFEEFAGIIRSRVFHLILLGETREKIARSCREVGFTRYTLVKDLPEGVKEAYHRARPGDLVLLSPACASWDMYKNFEERGTHFKALVASLEGRKRDEKTGQETGKKGS